MGGVAQLVIVACLVSSPADCREEVVTVSAAPIDAMACATAITAVADWSAQHTEWTVTRWSCRSTRRVSTQ